MRVASRRRRGVEAPVVDQYDRRHDCVAATYAEIDDGTWPWTEQRAQACARRRRRAAADRACSESAFRETVCLLSCFNAREVARERVADVRRARRCPARIAWRAFLLVAADACPLRGGFSLTPARRALESPMAIACFADRAPCFPSRTCSISSRTNSPA